MKTNNAILTNMETGEKTEVKLTAPVSNKAQKKLLNKMKKTMKKLEILAAKYRKTKKHLEEIESQYNDTVNKLGRKAESFKQMKAASKTKKDSKTKKRFDESKK